METDGFYTVITGASMGIGKAFAVEMARRGRNLILTSLPGENLPLLCEEIMKQFNNKVAFYETDLTQQDGPQKFYDYIKKNSFRVNFLINNAGMGFSGCLEKHSPECIDRMIALNIRAVTLITHFLTPELKKAPESYLVNICSFGSYLPSPYKSVYFSTKSFIYFFTRALHEEFRGSTIRTSAILPGTVRTSEIVRRRIEAVGIWGKFNVLEPEELARKSILKVFRGRRVIIEGRINRIIFNISTIIPEGILLNLLKKELKKMEVVG
ncbi:MAG: SDR family NAD(P)-dependent oxidoreductase [Bacteroidota bacterium]|nr:SDR family NAD(P)-dependent oxidoreductase [Bacteroidota bacterium]